MVTFSGLAQMSVGAALAGTNLEVTDYGLNSPMSKSEAYATAIGKVAETNIIQPRTGKKDSQLRPEKNIGLNREDINNLGQVGKLTAVTRAGGSYNALGQADTSIFGLSGTLIDAII